MDGRCKRVPYGVWTEGFAFLDEVIVRIRILLGIYQRLHLFLFLLSSFIEFKPSIMFH